MIYGQYMIYIYMIYLFHHFFSQNYQCRTSPVTIGGHACRPSTRGLGSLRASSNLERSKPCSSCSCCFSWTSVVRPQHCRISHGFCPVSITHRSSFKPTDIWELKVFPWIFGHVVVRWSGLALSAPWVWRCSKLPRGGQTNGQTTGATANEKRCAAVVSGLENQQRAGSGHWEVEMTFCTPSGEKIRNTISCFDDLSSTIPRECLGDSKHNFDFTGAKASDELLPGFSSFAPPRPGFVFLVGQLAFDSYSKNPLDEE